MMKVTLMLAFLFAVSLGCTLGTAPGCSDGIADGLSRQIIARLNAMGHTFKQLNGSAIHCQAPNCLGFLQAAAADALAAAAAYRHDFITLNSAFRSSASQYLLYKWWKEHRGCGIPLAAAPGTSNHEGGRAIDTSYYNYWRPTLEKFGWRWHGSNDVYHFDFFGAPDLARTNLQAFQQLYNQHNPNHRIAEDGIYGPATAAAFYNAPCGGW